MAGAEGVERVGVERVTRVEVGVGVGGFDRSVALGVLERRRRGLRVVAGGGGDLEEAAGGGGGGGGEARAAAWLASAEEVLGWLTAELDGVAPVLVADRLRRLGAVAERVQAALGALAGSVEASGQWAVEGATSATAWLMGEAEMVSGAAKRTVGVGRLVSQFAATGAAVADGSVSAAHAEVLAAAVLAKGRDRLYGRDEAVLLDVARELPVEVFARAVRRWVHLADDELDNGEPAAAFERRGLSFAGLPSGNLRVAGELDAAAGALVQAAFAVWDRPDPVGDECAPRTIAQRRADFVGDLAGLLLRSRNAEAHAPVATVDVVVDVDRVGRCCGGDAYRHGDGHGVRGQGGHQGSGAGSGDGGGGSAVAVDPLGWADAVVSGPLPSSLVDQVLCDCWVGRIALRGDGEVLEVGRRTRTWSPAQRRAIIARDRHCTHPGCTRGPEWCDVHHVEGWDDGGPTDVANGTLRCRWHHTWHHLHHRRARAPT